MLNRFQWLTFTFLLIANLSFARNPKLRAAAWVPMQVWGNHCGFEHAKHFSCQGFWHDTIECAYERKVSYHILGRKMSSRRYRGALVELQSMVHEFRLDCHHRAVVYWLWSCVHTVEDDGHSGKSEDIEHTPDGSLGRRYGTLQHA